MFYKFLIVMLLSLVLLSLVACTSTAGIFNAVSKAVTDTAKDIGGVVKDATALDLSAEMAEDIKAIDAIEEIKANDVEQFCKRFAELHKSRPRLADEYLKYAFGKLSVQYMNSKTREVLNKNQDLMVQFDEAFWNRRTQSPRYGERYRGMFNPYIQGRSAEKYREVAEAILQREKQEKIAAQQQETAKKIAAQQQETARIKAIVEKYASLLKADKDKFKDNNDFKAIDVKDLEKREDEISHYLSLGRYNEFWNDFRKLSIEYETLIRMVNQRIKTQLSEIKQKLIKFENQLEEYPITHNMYGSGKEWDMEAADLDAMTKEYYEIMQYYNDNKNYCDLGDAFDIGKHESIQYMLHKRFSSLIDKYEKIIQKKKEYEIAKQKRAKAKEEFEKNMQDPNYIYPNRAICKSEIPLYKSFKSGMRPDVVNGLPLDGDSLRTIDLGYYAVYLKYDSSKMTNKAQDGKNDDKTELIFFFAKKSPNDANAALVRVDITMPKKKISMEDIIQKYKKELGLDDNDVRISKNLKEKNVIMIEHSGEILGMRYKDPGQYELYELRCHLQRGGKSVMIVTHEHRIQYQGTDNMPGDMKFYADRILEGIEVLSKKMEILQIFISDENQIEAYRKFYEADMQRKAVQEKRAKEKEKDSILDF